MAKAQARVPVIPDREAAQKVVNHLCDKWQISISEFARGAGVDGSRLLGAMRNELNLNPDEVAALQDQVNDAVEAEDWDVYEAKLRGLTPPTTIRDILEGR